MERSVLTDGNLEGSFYLELSQVEGVMGVN